MYHEISHLTWKGRYPETVETRIFRVTDFENAVRTRSGSDFGPKIQILHLNGYKII